MFDWGSYGGVWRIAPRETVWRDPDTVLVKQPSESRVYEFDFVPLLFGGAELTGTPDVTCGPPGPGDLVITEPEATAGRVRVRLAGGTNARYYKVTARCGTTAGDRLEADGKLLVWDQ